MTNVSTRLPARPFLAEYLVFAKRESGRLKQVSGIVTFVLISSFLQQILEYRHAFCQAKITVSLDTKNKCLNQMTGSVEVSVTDG